MTTDEYRSNVPSRLRERARERAAMWGGEGRPDAAVLLGYLEASVAKDLQRPRLLSRDQLVVDLMTVDLLWNRGKK